MEGAATFADYDPGPMATGCPAHQPL